MSWDYPIVERREIGVAVERRTLKSQWAEYRWHPAAIFSELPAAAPWTELARTPDAARFYIGPATLELVALAILMPIVASQGGNAATQTMTLVVRALATRTLGPQNRMRVARLWTAAGAAWRSWKPLSTPGISSLRKLMP